MIVGLLWKLGREKGLDGVELLQWWSWHDLMMYMCCGMGKGQEVKEVGL